jgi:bifunctional UDP-N-acetylglucosamine pyrophosphorylase/glucosamine-1-phosphate N-acetyltransferase
VRFYEQQERLGTAHAVLAAEMALASQPDDVLVLFADTPLLSAATLGRMRAALAAGANMVVLAFRPNDPAGYGRLILDGGRLVAIREHDDASAKERAIGLCNAGVMAFHGEGLSQTLRRIGNENAKLEYYLTDAVAIVAGGGGSIIVVETDAEEVEGVNTRHQLAHVEGIFQRRAREAAMAAGVTLIAPSTVWFSHDTVVGTDVTIEPNVFFAPGVRIGDNVTLRANSHIEGATVESGAVVGPFARLRPGARIGAGAHIGNFVEIKNAEVEQGAKVNHLAYIGDARVGARTNVGAGAITCNYDGFDKHRTDIGADAFIGSNTSLVAPVSIGDGAYVASGSVVTRDVAGNALAVARAKQIDKPEWATNFREMKQRSREAKSGKGD